MQAYAVPAWSGQHRGPKPSLDFHTNSTASVQGEPTVKHKVRDGSSVAERIKILYKIAGFLVAENLHNIFSKSDFSISFHNNKQC